MNASSSTPHPLVSFSYMMSGALHSCANTAGNILKATVGTTLNIIH